MLRTGGTVSCARERRWYGRRGHCLTQVELIEAFIACSVRVRWAAQLCTFLALGQFALAVLALIVSIYHRMDGREAYHRRAHLAVRGCSTNGHDRALFAPAVDHPCAGTELDSEEGRRTRLEGQTIAGVVHRRDPGGAAFLPIAPAGLVIAALIWLIPEPAHRKPSCDISLPDTRPR